MGHIYITLFNPSDVPTHNPDDHESSDNDLAVHDVVVQAEFQDNGDGQLSREELQRASNALHQALRSTPSISGYYREATPTIRIRESGSTIPSTASIRAGDSIITTFRARPNAPAPIEAGATSLQETYLRRFLEERGEHRTDDVVPPVLVSQTTDSDAGTQSIINNPVTLTASGLQDLTTRFAPSSLRDLFEMVGYARSIAPYRQSPTRPTPPPAHGGIIHSLDLNRMLIDYAERHNIPAMRTEADVNRWISEFRPTPDSPPEMPTIPNLEEHERQQIMALLDLSAIPSGRVDIDGSTPGASALSTEFSEIYHIINQANTQDPSRTDGRFRGGYTDPRTGQHTNTIEPQEVRTIAYYLSSKDRPGGGSLNDTDVRWGYRMIAAYINLVTIYQYIMRSTQPDAGARR